jgi:hypothetical protein
MKKFLIPGAVAFVGLILLVGLWRLGTIAPPAETVEVPVKLNLP